MPRRTCKLEAGQYYHIYNRGALKSPLYFEPGNYRYFTELLYRCAGEHNVTIIAFCLMPNHFHILIRVEVGGDVPKWIGRVCQAYSMFCNRKYGRVGTSFQQRYQCIHIHNEAYLFHICRYIHANPVKGGLVSHAESWEHSDYQEWIGVRSRLAIDEEFVRSRYGDALTYATFVEDLLDVRTLSNKDYSEGLLRMHLLDPAA